MLVVSFVALGLLWRTARFDDDSAGRPLPGALQAVVLSPALRVVLGALSFSLLVVVALAALLGSRSPTQNLAPTFVFVVFWLGLVPVVVLLGNVWSVLNPWRAAADAAAWLWARLGRSWEPLGAYPERLGRWPAAFLLFAFAAFELAYESPGAPRSLALAIYLYSAITWFGMLWYGRRAWLESAEAFTVYFGLLSRLAPFGMRERGGRREAVVRPPLSGLGVRDWRPGTLAFVAVMLGSVAFDGLSRIAWWQDGRYSLETSVASESAGSLLAMLMNLAGLLAVVVLVALAYLGAVRAAEAVSGTRQPLTGAFLASLIPIALAYAVAHYFSLLVLQGQFALPLASDPLGRGWDLLRTADVQPNLGLLSPNVIWYVQVGTLVAGHVAGLALAHDRAISLFRSPRTATRTQYAMLALMVLYTVAGLWLLSRG